MNENKLENNSVPLVVIAMGSEPVLKIPYEIEAVSARRTPDRIYQYSNSAEKRELEDKLDESWSVDNEKIN